MIKINLLPHRETKKLSDSIRQLIIIAAAFVCFVLAMISVHLYLYISANSLEEKIASEKQQLAALTKTAAEIDKVRGDKKLFEKKLEIIKALEGNRLKPVMLLDNLTSVVSSGQVWLTNFSESGTALKLEGTARDNTSIAVLMKSLEKSGYFSSVDLVSSKQAVVANIKLQAFILSCTLK